MKIFNNIKSIFFTFIIICILAFVYFVVYVKAEPIAYDFFTKHVLTKRLPFDIKKKTTGHDDIVLIVIDAKTNEKYRWPWKRERFCPILNYLKDYAKPKAIVFDVIIGAPDADNPESDKVFFNTLSKFNNITTAFMPMEQDWENEEEGLQYEKDFAEKFSIKNIEYRVNKHEYEIYNSFLKNPKDYLKSIKHMGDPFTFPGFINGNLYPLFRDDVYRTHNYTTRYKDTIYPSLALSPFLIIHNYPKMVVTNDYIDFPDLNYRIPQKTSKFISFTPIRFYNTEYEYIYSHKNYSASDIMDSYFDIQAGRKPLINPEEFKDKIVILGANFVSGAGTNDRSNTPISTNHPGIDISATAVDNLVHNDFLTITPKWFNFLTAILGMLFVFLIIQKNNLIKSVTYTLAIILGYILFAALCFYYIIIVNVITPVVMFVLTMIIAYTHKYTIENRSKEQVKSAMSRYMSEDVMKRVIQNIDNLGLGGKKANVTVLFSDIRGFTSLSEKMQAQQVSELLNEYFSAMEPIVTKYNGIINKFIGDAIMAVFGEPINDENHPLNAVKCGYEMLLKVQELHKKWEDEGKPQIEIGIGINTGEVFVGNIGSERRMEYTVIGDTVNLASRLESYNKTYQTKMLISQSTYEQAKNKIYVVKIPEVEIRGKSKKIDIYEVLKVIE